MSYFEIIKQLSLSAAYTILVTLACSATAFFLGFTLTILSRSPSRIVVFFCDLFSFIFRATPILVLIFLIYYGSPALGIDISPLLTMCLSVGVISGSYIYELMRGTLTTIEKTQLLSAKSFGFTKRQVFILVELPQAIRFSMPGIINEFTVILKYSPFSYVVGIPEITRKATILSTVSDQAVAIYLIAGIMYFIIYKVFQSLAIMLERKYKVPGINDI